MPCHIPATSASSRRKPPSLSRKPPVIAAKLDLSKPGERAAHDLLRRYSTGRWPLWRVLGVKRAGKTLYVAIEWRRSIESDRYALAELSLTQEAVHFPPMPDAAAALAALAKAGRMSARTNPR